jgi:hypothetical protein
MSSNREQSHNDGQTDASQGNGYNAPHGLLDSILTWSSEGCKEITEDNSAYREGYEHTQSQTK